MLVEARQSLARIPPSKVSTIREGITGLSLEGRPFLSIIPKGPAFLIGHASEKAKAVVDRTSVVGSLDVGRGSERFYRRGGRGGGRSRCSRCKGRHDFEEQCGGGGVLRSDQLLKNSDLSNLFNLSVFSSGF